MTEKFSALAMMLLSIVNVLDYLSPRRKARKEKKFQQSKTWRLCVSARTISYFPKGPSLRSGRVDRREPAINSFLPRAYKHPGFESSPWFRAYETYSWDRFCHSQRPSPIRESCNSRCSGRDCPTSTLSLLLHS